MSNTKQKKTLHLGFPKKDHKYSVFLQLYERQLDEVKKKDISFFFHKYFVEENDTGAIFGAKLSLDTQKKQSIDYKTDLLILLQKKLVFQLNHKGIIVNIYNIGEIKEDWDDQKKKYYNKYKDIGSIKDEIEEVNLLLNNQNQFLQYILNQEIYQLLFPGIYNIELTSTPSTRSNKQYSNLFKKMMLPIINYSFLEDHDTKKDTVHMYEIETINIKDFDGSQLLKEYKEKYNTGNIELEHNTVRNYTIRTAGYISIAESIKKTEISDFENKEQITSIELLIQPD